MMLCNRLTAMSLVLVKDVTFQSHTQSKDGAAIQHSINLHHTYDIKHPLNS